MRSSIHRVAIGFLLLMLGIAQAAADEWIDMGPLNGSVEGQVWSKVINEAGQTQARSESWQVQLPAPAIPEFQLKCPDAYPLEVRVQTKSAYGELSEYLLDRVAGGFYKKFSSAWDPQSTRDIRVLVSARQPGTDQHYQLTVNLFDAAGQPLQPAAPANVNPAPSAADEFLGTWLRRENGSIAEYMQLAQSGQGIEIIFLSADRRTIVSRMPARWEGQALLGTSSTRKVRIVVVDGTLDYTSSNHDGSGVWNGQFIRE